MVLALFVRKEDFMPKLIVNVGSTSVKTQLFDENMHVKATINADYGAADGLLIKGVDSAGVPFEQRDKNVHDAQRTLTYLFEHWQHLLTTHGITLSAIGHRVVHGSTLFNKITPLNNEVLTQLAQLDDYAPLHNPLNRLGIAMAGDVFANVLQFAVFDTAFHRQIPPYAGRYAIPERLSEHITFYRYGFHGISCQHSLHKAAALLNKSPSEINVIILHLGGGASATVVQQGISVDTSMGFSPTEGLIMATRSGDIDPMIAITLQHEGKSIDALHQLLNKESGLKGICGQLDMRTILAQAQQGDDACHLALKMFCYRIQKYVGAYFAVLNGDVDALIFTGGIGENAPAVRQQITENLSGLGFVLDLALNANHPINTDVSSQSSRSRILVIHAEEEREIAQQIQTFIVTA
jgi:acetate kinase